MNIDDIKGLKDKIYEIEGLLELAQLREDKIPELEPLIVSRIRTLLDSGETPEKQQEETPVEPQEGTPVEPQEEISVEPQFEPQSEQRVSAPAEKQEIPEKVEDAVAQEFRKPKLDKPAFCLNDRFRFKRELFSNSDAEFSSAMNAVAAMDSYDEAEEYFIGELGWNEENPEVIGFMEIIRGYFES